MRILVRHGHFAFYPSNLSDIANFCRIFDVALERVDDYYTFPLLKSLKDWSLPLYPYGNLPAIVKYEGKPWEVMKANNFVYSLSLKILVPKVSILGVFSPTQSGPYYTTNQAIVQPGIIATTGQRFMSYDGIFDFNTQKLRVREFQYE